MLTDKCTNFLLWLAPHCRVNLLLTTTSIGSVTSPKDDVKCYKGLGLVWQVRVTNGIKLQGEVLNEGYFKRKPGWKYRLLFKKLKE